jgi:hypothetical protein
VNFGSTADPRPTNETVGVVGEGVDLTFGRVSTDGRRYVVLGTTDPALGMLVSNGLAIVNSGAGVASYTNYLAGSTNRFFYKLMTVSSNNASVVTNEETYAAYKQSREQANYYWVGIPVDYGASNSLDSTLGQHLARGLNRGTSLAIADTLKVFSPTEQMAYLHTDGKWRYNGGDVATNRIARGQAVLIQKRAITSSDGYGNSVFVGLALGNNTNTVAIKPGWNLLCWPEDISNNVWNLSSANGSDAFPSEADRIWLPSRNGKPAKQLRLWSTMGWQFEPRTGTAPSNDAVWAYLQPGEGFFYTNSGASDLTWQP